MAPLQADPTPIAPTPIAPTAVAARRANPVSAGAGELPPAAIGASDTALIDGTMPTLLFRTYGGPEVLRIETRPIPVPVADEVLVEIGAVALNGFDPMVLRGLPTLATPLPMIPCADAAGTIAALGPEADASAWRVGQRVSIVPLRPGRGMAGETLPGYACRFATVPQAALLALPDTVGDVEAAALPTAYGTALRMVRSRGRVRAGERVLVMGASGGVGTACVQLAARAGAEVIACAGSDEALATLTTLGAAATIHTGREDVLGEVLARYGKPSLWGGGGVDVVVNAVGGDTFAASLACLTRGGRLLTCGASAGPQVGMDLRYVWSFEIEIIGANGWSADDQADLIAMVAAGEIAPAIHAVRPLSASRDAYEELIGQRVTGKSILLP